MYSIQPLYTSSVRTATVSRQGVLTVIKTCKFKENKSSFCKDSCRLKRVCLQYYIRLTYSLVLSEYTCYCKMLRGFMYAE